MRVLITNNTLHVRGGAESFMRDLAGDLQNCGHSVMVYSADPQDADHFRGIDVIQSVDDLENLPEPPDIIHAQHHMDAMTALTALPNIPAIYHCHGAVWRESVPKHPRIHHYLAMSRTLRERMMIEYNLTPDSVDVFLNGVDPRRFCQVRKLPQRPRRGLFYNKFSHRNSPNALAVESAAAAMGIELDWIGRNFERMIGDPENILPNYDVVFASGRSAIEALACGCAVVVLGRTSCGEMVTPANFDRYRQVNFSIAVNSPPPSVEEISRQLLHFSPARCKLVTERIRIEADSRDAVRTLTALYERVIERHRTTKIDVREELLALSHYMRRLVPIVRITDELQNGVHSTRTSAVHQLLTQMEMVKHRLTL
ncbi:MAG: glycosyltransferase [Chthoniobacterales bacterium]